MDLGGDGDCGLRALAYASALLHDIEKGTMRKPEESISKAQKRGVMLRIKISEALDGDES